MKTEKYNERKAMIELVGWIMDGKGIDDFLEQYREWDWENHKPIDPPEYTEDGQHNDKYTEFVHAKKAVANFIAKLDTLL